MGKLTVRHARLRFVIVNDFASNSNFIEETDKFYNIVEWNYWCEDRVNNNVGRVWLNQSIQTTYDNIIQSYTTLGRDSDAVFKNYCNGIYAFDFGVDEDKVKLTSSLFNDFITAPPLIFSETVPHIDRLKSKDYQGYETILNAICISYTDDSKTMVSGDRKFLSKVKPRDIPLRTLGDFYSKPITILKLKKVEPSERGRLGSSLDYRDHDISELVDYINNRDKKYGDVQFTLDYYQDQFLKDYGLVSDDKKKQQLITNLFQKL